MASAAGDAAPAKQSGGTRVSVEQNFAELRQRLREISHLGAAASVLGWDEATYMPTGGAAARGRQTATLSRLAHERATDPALGRLLDDLAARPDAVAPASDDASLLRIARRDFEKSIRVPSDFVARLSVAGSQSYNAWIKARSANDFAAMRPHLERALDFSRQYAEFFAPYAHVADPFIDGNDEGMTAETVRLLFAELRRGLLPLVREITAQPAADDRCLHAEFEEERQLAFGLTAACRFGYDLARGRQDKTHHPFCTKFSSGDVRITTRVQRNNLGEALFSTLHEAGHALYEQGVSPAFEDTPLNWGVSAGVHESQSRLWENVVGRSRAFWEHAFPLLREQFPEALAGVSVEMFYRAINKVERSLIRTDADEVTYNLHVMMRFDLEDDLLTGKLAVADLPEAWRARIAADIGVTPPDDRDGCLQDVHWFGGMIGGGFQGYTIGNVLSVQFFEAALRQHSEIGSEIARGEFATLHGWLRENIYRHGRKFTPNDLIAQATGGPLSVAPYLRYLRAKYGELYDLSAISA